MMWNASKSIERGLGINHACNSVWGIALPQPVFAFAWFLA